MRIINKSLKFLAKWLIAKPAIWTFSTFADYFVLLFGGRGLEATPREKRMIGAFLLLIVIMSSFYLPARSVIDHLDMVRQLKTQSANAQMKEKVEGVKEIQIIKEPVKAYEYNEQISKEEVEREIRSQAKAYGLDPEKMVSLAKCESGLDNLIKNKKSTALGVYQYLIGTWQETDSFKNNKTARTDYKANIKEAMIDVANGEIWRWKDCSAKIGF